MRLYADFAVLDALEARLLEQISRILLRLRVLLLGLFEDLFARRLFHPAHGEVQFRLGVERLIFLLFFLVQKSGSCIQVRRLRVLFLALFCNVIPVEFFEPANESAVEVLDDGKVLQNVLLFLLDLHFLLEFLHQINSNVSTENGTLLLVFVVNLQTVEDGVSLGQLLIDFSQGVSLGLEFFLLREILLQVGFSYLFGLPGDFLDLFLGTLLEQGKHLEVSQHVSHEDLESVGRNGQSLVFSVRGGEGLEANPLLNTPNLH